MKASVVDTTSPGTCVCTCAHTLPQWSAFILSSTVFPKLPRGRRLSCFSSLLPPFPQNPFAPDPPEILITRQACVFLSLICAKDTLNYRIYTRKSLLLQYDRTQLVRLCRRFLQSRGPPGPALPAAPLSVRACAEAPTARLAPSSSCGPGNSLLR